MKHVTSQTWAVSVGAAIFFVLGAALWPTSVCACSKANRKQAALFNLKQLGTASAIYAADYDGRFMPADAWASDVMPYVKNEAIFDDPLTAPEKLGFAFYEPVGAVVQASITDPEETPLLFQSLIRERNAHSDLRSLPTELRDPAGDAYVHVSGSARYRARTWAIEWSRRNLVRRLP